MGLLAKLFGTGKQSTTWTANDVGEIVKVEIIDGEVVEETGQTDSWTDDAWAFFRSGKHNQSVGGSDWEKKYKRKDAPPAAPTVGGMQYNDVADRWEYPPSASKAAPYHQRIIEGYGDERATDGGL